MAFFSRIKGGSAPAIPSDGVSRSSSRESVKKPILLRAHTSGINDLACDIKQKHVWTVSKDGSIAVWEEPVKIKAERSATPRIIEAGLGEVICVFYNSASKQFWTSHKASNTIVMWSSTGNKDREMRLESAHPVNCFCKVGEEEVWAGTFDSIIMLSNKGDRLHSTSTGAGRMIFIKQQGHVWSGGGVSTSDLLASSSIFQWTVVHPHNARQNVKLDNPFHKQRLTCMCETKEHIWTGCKGKVVCVWSKKATDSVPKVVHFMLDMPSAPLDIVFAGSHVWLCAEDGYVRCWKDTSDPVLLNVFHVVQEQRVPRLLHVPKCDQLWCVRDDGSVSVLDVSNGALQSQNVVHMFKNAAGDRYVGEIKECSIIDPMQLSIADDGTERSNFIKEGRGELHYANEDLYVGQFFDDMRHGHGVLRRADGSRFFGQWKNDVRDGPGIDVKPDGTCFEGIFSKNVRKGYGTLQLPTGAKIEGIWNDSEIVSAKYTESAHPDANDKHRMLLLQCDLQSKLEKLANEELEEHSDHLWGTFISQRPQPTSQDLSTDIKALTMLLKEGQEPAKAYFQLKLKDRSHPIGRLIQEFIDFFLAAYHGQKVLRDKRTAQYFLHHACHDVHSFSAELCRIQLVPFYQRAVTNVFGESHEDEHDVMHACHSSLHIVLLDKIYDPIIKLYRFVFKDKDVQYSTKLRALSDAQVEDFGAKLAVQRVEDNVPDASRASVAFSSDCSTSVGSASDTPFDGSSEFVRDSLNFDKLGLGEFLKEVEAQGVDAIQQQYMTDIVESPETKEMTPEQYFDQYPRPYLQAISEMRKLSESTPDERCRDAIKKSHIILNITGAIVSYWKHGGINMEKLGADDLMPAFMYSLVKANVPYLYSELQFLNDFVVERNYSSDEFNHYLMTRKRMSDLEAALHFINSIDMNVRDEKNALVPVTTMVDRVIDILHVGVAECMQRKVVRSQDHAPDPFSSQKQDAAHAVDIRIIPKNKQSGPEVGRTTTFAPSWSRSQLMLQCSQLRIFCSAVIQQLFHETAPHTPDNSVGIELKESEGFQSPSDSPIIQGRKKQQQLQDQSFPDYIISFRQTFPLHVYGKLAEEVASYSLGENAR